MAIGLGITIWLDRTRHDLVVVFVFGSIITRGLGTHRLITRGYGRN